MRVVGIVSLVDESWPRRRLSWFAASGILLALLLAAMSLGGLVLESTYARENAAWTTQAVAQDWFDLFIAAPVLAITALWAARGSRRGLLAYAGALLFTVYTVVIYAFAVHLNALFLLYCAALGVALYALIATASRASQFADTLRIGARVPRRQAGGFLIAIGTLFAFLWLTQLVPAAVYGTVPEELTATGLFTNPVHVLDLSFILPLHVIGGLALWRGTRLAWVAPVVLVFGALMAPSITFMTLAAGSVPVTLGMGLITLASVYLAARTLRAFR